MRMVKQQIGWIRFDNGKTLRLYKAMTKAGVRFWYQGSFLTNFRLFPIAEAEAKSRFVPLTELAVN